MSYSFKENESEEKWTEKERQLTIFNIFTVRFRDAHLSHATDQILFGHVALNVVADELWLRIRRTYVIRTLRLAGRRLATLWAQIGQRITLNQGNPIKVVPPEALLVYPAKEKEERS